MYGALMKNETVSATKILAMNPQSLNRLREYCTENGKDLTGLYGISIIELPSRYIYIQKRKHRKKRTNKKWAKRYGFKKVEIDEAYLVQDPGFSESLSIDWALK
jgi:hypothetical protein